MTSPSYQLPGSKILLMGESGTGKTYSIRTFLPKSITPFCIFTEPGMESLTDLGDKIHYTYIPPTVEGWDSLLKVAQNVNTLTFDSLTKMQDPNKRLYTGFMSVINACNQFTDQNSQEFGDVAQWGPDRVLVLDSLSGLSDLAMQLATGGKVTRAMQDWMVAQNLLENLINKLTTDLSCWLVLIAHIERETDEITGGTSIMVSTLGRKLAPRLPRYFSDVIQAKREGDKFTWDTAGYNVAVKARNLPISSKLPQDFGQIVESWQKKGGVIPSSNPKATST